MEKNTEAVGIKRLAEIFEWLVITEGDVDFYATEDLYWRWNAKIIKIADANYLSVAYYGGSERSAIFLVEETGFAGGENDYEYMAGEVMERAHAGPGHPLYLDKTSDGWEKMILDLKNLTLKKALSNGGYQHG